MGETQHTAESEGEEMHLDNQNKVSDCSENEAKSEDEARIENSELEENESGAAAAVTLEEKNPSKCSEFGDNLVKSGERVKIEKTSLENGSRNRNKDENGNRSTAGSEETQQEMEAEPEKPQLQKEISSINRANPVDSEFSNEKDVGDNGAGEGEGEGQIGNFDFDYWSDGDDSGTEEEQIAFMNELEKFHIDNNLEFKPPKFYGEGLNLLKLWRQTTRLGCYEKVTSQKFWRQVGESFNPPRTCTTVSWTFRGFYEKALLEYEKHKIRTGQLQAAMPELPMPLLGSEGGPGSGRARRDAAARAMEGWHSQRVLGNGEIADAIIKDRSAPSLSKKDKFLKSSGGSVKRKKPCTPDRNDNKLALVRFEKPQLDISIVDEGPPADWVKVNVKKTKDCYEVYALVPGLLREEVKVKSDPSGRLVVSGEPEQPDNPWGVTPFKKVITLPSCIDPHNTSAVVTLHGQLFVRAPFPATNARHK